MNDQLSKDVVLMREALDNDLAISQPRMPAQPLLLAMCGLPGTGKSYFAARLAERVPFLILETDRLRKVLVEHPKYSKYLSKEPTMQRASRFLLRQVQNVYSKEF